MFDLTVDSRVRRNRTADLPMCPTELCQTDAAPLVVFADGLNTTLARLDRTPVLIMHGAQDTNVPLGQSVYFHRALRHFGVEHEFVIYPREGHSIRERHHQLDVLRRTRAWFDRWLGP